MCVLKCIFSVDDLLVISLLLFFSLPISLSLFCSLFLFLCPCISLFFNPLSLSLFYAYPEFKMQTFTSVSF